MLEDRRDRLVRAHVLAARVLAEIDPLEHERAEREHRGADLFALRRCRRRLGALDQVVHERVDPRSSRSPEQLDLRARQVAGRRAAPSGSRRRCHG